MIFTLAQAKTDKDAASNLVKDLQKGEENFQTRLEKIQCELLDSQRLSAVSQKERDKVWSNIKVFLALD